LLAGARLSFACGTRRGLREILPVPSAAIHNSGDEKMRFDNAEYRTL
jgi:hypothetical protein